MLNIKVLLCALVLALSLVACKRAGDVKPQDELLHPEAAQVSAEAYRRTMEAVVHVAMPPMPHDEEPFTAIELSDLLPEEFLFFDQNEVLFEEGSELPASDERLPARLRERKAFDIMTTTSQAPIAAFVSSYKFYRGAGEDHVLAVVQPAQPLNEEGGVAVASGSLGEGASFKEVQPIAASDAQLKALHDHIRASLSAEEAQSLPARLTAQHVTLVPLHGWGKHKLLASVRVVLSEQIDEPQITALLALDERGQVSAEVGAPGLQLEYFEPVAELRLARDWPGMILYGSVYYEGYYVMLLRFDEAGQPVVISIAGDGA